MSQKDSLGKATDVGIIGRGGLEVAGKNWQYF